MKAILIINGIVEITAGLAFLFWPGVTEFLPGPIHANNDPNITMLLSMYGTAVVVLGSYSLLLLRHTQRSALLVGSLLLFALFHTGIGINQLLVNPDLRPALLHITLAVAFWWTFQKQRSTIQTTTE